METKSAGARSVDQKEDGLCDSGRRIFPHLSAGDNMTLMARHLKWDIGRIEGRLPSWQI